MPPSRARPHSALTALQKRADHSVATTSIRLIQRSADALVQRDVDDSPITAGHAYYGNDGLEWDQSKGVPAWAQTAYVNKDGQTGEVDDSSSPRLPTYGPDEVPGWKQNDPAGIPRWAQEELADPTQSLMCSMVDGKIGSIYFEGGRVRTTHRAGPTKSEHEQSRTFQFNIDRKAAKQNYVSSGAYERAEARAKRSKSNRTSGQRFNGWIAQQLKGKGVTETPAWAHPLPDATAALVDDGNQDTKGLKLFEVMMKEGGVDIASKHPSRGAAVQIDIKQSELQKLKEAGAAFADVKNPRRANELFYDYVSREVPHLLPKLRKPSEISY